MCLISFGLVWFLLISFLVVVVVVVCVDLCFFMGYALRQPVT